jgi:hypothetical protein
MGPGRGDARKNQKKQQQKPVHLKKPVPLAALVEHWHALKVSPAL